MNKFKLKGTKYRIQEQFSEKITNERKSFQPLIEEAMADEKRFYVKYNKLIIDDKTCMKQNLYSRSNRMLARQPMPLPAGEM